MNKKNKKIIKLEILVITIMFLAVLQIMVNAKSILADTFKTGAQNNDVTELTKHKVDISVGNNLNKAVEYPAKSDISTSKYFPAISNQGGLGSCVAFATTYYQFTYEANRLNNISSNSISTCYSPSWTYNYMNGGVDAGMSNNAAYEHLKERGALKLSEFPYTDDYKCWSKNTQAMINALKTRVSDYYALYLDTANKNITNIRSNYLYMIKEKLSSGKCLVISCQTDGKMSNMMKGNATNGELVIY